MIRKYFLFLVILLILPLQSIFSLDITEKEVEGYLRAEYNRSYPFFGNISILGNIELNDIWTIRGGLSFGGSSGITDINTLLSASVFPFSALPLGFSLLYIYNGLPEYRAHDHAILPLVSLNGERAGLSVGCNFRLSSFYGSDALFESVLTFLGYLNFINNEKLRLGISAGNLSDFKAENLGMMSLSVNSQVNINEKWSVVNDIQLLQSGLDGFTATFYGIAWRGGVKYKW
jgi:hypothetical protein